VPELLRTAGAIALLNVTYRAGLRPRLARLGATDAEARCPLPGDDVLPVGADTSTMATTIDAPPADVWPWLVQMGCGRAGWYSYDRLDNGGRPSAERIVPEWQLVSAGQRLSSDASGRGRYWFAIERLDPERSLVLRACIDLSTGLSYEPGHGRPEAFSDSTWAFHLEPLDGDRARLLVRSRVEAAPLWRAVTMSMAFGLPSHAIMQTRQFRNLKRLARKTTRPAAAPAEKPWPRTATPV
jgi:hypothetical protein